MVNVVDVAFLAFLHNIRVDPLGVSLGLSGPVWRLKLFYKVDKSFGYIFMFTHLQNTLSLSLTVNVMICYNLG